MAVFLPTERKAALLLHAIMLQQICSILSATYIKTAVRNNGGFPPHGAKSRSFIARDQAAADLLRLYRGYKKDRSEKCCSLLLYSYGSPI